MVTPSRSHKGCKRAEFRSFHIAIWQCFTGASSARVNHLGASCVLAGTRKGAHVITRLPVVLGALASIIVMASPSVAQADRIRISGGVHWRGGVSVGYSRPVWRPHRYHVSGSIYVGPRYVYYPRPYYVYYPTYVPSYYATS